MIENLTREDVLNTLTMFGFKVEEPIQDNDRKIVLYKTYIPKIKENNSINFDRTFDSITETEFVEMCEYLTEQAIENFETFKKTMFNFYVYYNNVHANEIGLSDIDIARFEKESKELYKLESFQKKYINKKIKETQIKNIKNIDFDCINQTIDYISFDVKFGLGTGTPMFPFKSGGNNDYIFKYIWQEISSKKEILKHIKNINFVCYSHSYCMVDSLYGFAIEPEFDETGIEMIKHNKEILGNAIENFYKGATYFGD